MHLRPLMVALACLQAGCASLTPFESPPPETAPVAELASTAAQLPEPLKRPCKHPVALPAHDLTEGEVSRYWGLDRAALADCGVRHAATTRFYRKRDAGLAGARK